MKSLFILAACIVTTCLGVTARDVNNIKPRIIVSTDIGGTDPDDNQSMTHFLMYNSQFDIEGIISSASYGPGSKEEILRMIDIYEADYEKLKKHDKDLLTPQELRKLCKQGRRGLASYKGYDDKTEGSECIVECARRSSDRPLWILVWGTLEDVAQALHDAPDIKDNIRVYWIGGPNKKWGVNSYAYIAENFPDLWFIENNAAYRGFISDNNVHDKYNTGYYDAAIKGAGQLGKDFKNYYKGIVKMGDTPSLLYMMDGDPNNPFKECWGGSFENIYESPRTVFNHIPTVKDTVAVYSVMELMFKGPVLDASEKGKKYFTMRVDKQDWDGVYLGDGTYAVRYSPKAPAVLTFTTQSNIKELNGLSGTFVVSGEWPGKPTKLGYKLGDHWYSDKQAPELFDGPWQGVKTVSKWRNEVLDDWAERWEWLSE